MIPGSSKYISQIRKNLFRKHFQIYHTNIILQDKVDLYEIVHFFRVLSHLNFKALY